MIKKFVYSEFPINGFEVDSYCEAFFDEYGEDSAVAKAVDEEYENIRSEGKTYCDFLNALRERLCDRGFSSEVEQQDIKFESKMQEEFSRINKYSGKTVRETRLAHIPLDKRWEMDEQKNSVPVYRLISKPKT